MLRYLLFVGLGLLAGPSVARATLLASYNAAVGPTVVAPNTQDSRWIPVNLTTGTVAPITNDLGQGIKAWSITAVGGTPRYTYGIDSYTTSRAVAEGWRFHANARFTNDISFIGSTGLTAYWQNKAYFLAFELNSSGALTAMAMEGSNFSLIPLTTGGASTQYYDIELRQEPGSSHVEFWFDGQFQRNLAGTLSTHPNSVQFGNMFQTGSGKMHFRTVSYEIGTAGTTLPQVAGDFNADGVVDAADYTLWRNTFGQSVPLYTGADANGNGLVDLLDYNLWKENFGETARGLATSSVGVVPEPATGLMGLVVLAGWLGCHVARRPLSQVKN